MFTGIVEELGCVEDITERGDSARIKVLGSVVAADMNPGDSIAVNGCCLTAVNPHEQGFEADVMKESLQRSNLGQLRAGNNVNLERAMPAGGRFGGHIVQGHVDGLGTVCDRTVSEHWELFRIDLEAALGRYLVNQGSVTVDGVSLTVVEAAEDGSWFTAGLIPTTLTATTLGQRDPGSMVNVELDVLAKYVERLLSGGRKEGCP